ncbi:FXYD domain-containing ion transport regulator 5 isoform 4-T6 [Dama dama]|uniref:FXYD domain-containing ion transport regulator 5 isoform X3 n=1 Tax=Dama dama TaxID=30532 RepID=UPI002A364A28|nr:FXYD domain-containing ion transport regulator 5 isoform X3 [Dama dama]
MSPSGRLCLFITVGLILPTRGQILKEAITPADPATEIIDVLTPALGSTPSKTKSPANPTHGSTPSKTQSPSRDERRDSILRQPGSKEDDPFFYDENTLRKRGLMVAAVLFITGIVILTSGKCRQLPRLCWNRDR